MRRVCLSVAVLLLTAKLAPAATFNWPQWQGPHRNCLTEEKGLLKAWPEGGPKRLWMFENCGSGYAGPAIVDGKLYILGERNDESQLIVIDAKNGKELGHAPISTAYKNDWGNGPRSTPAVDKGSVYALDASGTLICVRAKDGGEAWRVTMESLGGKVPNWGFTESPLIDGNKVLCTPGGPNGTIAALDKRSGKVLWQSKELTDAAHYSSIVSAKINGQPQYVQLLSQRLVGISPKNGKLLWEVPWPGQTAVIPTPLVHDNHVFATSGYGVGCMLVEISPKNEAKKLYFNKEMKNKHGGVIRVGDYLYGFTDDAGPGGWLCMNFLSGERKWREREALGMGAIGYADGMFYCVDQDDGNVVLIEASPDAWTERGRFKLDPLSKNRSPRGGIWVHPVIVDGKLFLRDQEFLYCYDVRE